MKRPILFSGEMVRAILDGRKSMTRRVVKEIPMLGTPIAWCAAAKAQEPGWVHIVGDYRRFCPYGIPGDRLWVRETWKLWEDPKDGHDWVLYRAGGKMSFPNIEHLDMPRDPFADKWRPSIFMPRWASRITLEITGVRVERVQDITEGDVREEGITDGGCLNCGEHEPCGCDNPQPDARDAFIWLWDSINKKRGYGWHVNPWVWVIEFNRVEADHA